MTWMAFTDTAGHAVLINLDECDRLRHPNKADPKGAGCVFTLAGGGEQAITETFADVAALLTRR